jgi:hypothetical protein
MEAIHLDQYFWRHQTFHPLNSTFLRSYYSANYIHTIDFFTAIQQVHYALELQGVPILFDTGTGNKKKLIDITKLAQQYQQELCTALLGLVPS